MEHNERQRQIETDTQRDTHTDREGDTHTQRSEEIVKHRQAPLRQKHTNGKIHECTYTEAGRQTNKPGDTKRGQMQTERQTETYRQTERGRQNEIQEMRIGVYAIHNYTYIKGKQGRE